jgi:hypothetical protein
VQGRGSTMAAFDSSEKHDFLDDLWLCLVVTCSVLCSS